MTKEDLLEYPYIGPSLRLDANGKISKEEMDKLGENEPYFSP